MKNKWKLVNASDTWTEWFDNKNDKNCTHRPFQVILDMIMTNCVQDGKVGEVMKVLQEKRFDYTRKTKKNSKKICKRSTNLLEYKRQILSIFYSYSNNWWNRQVAMYQET